MVHWFSKIRERTDPAVKKTQKRSLLYSRSVPHLCNVSVWMLSVVLLFSLFLLHGSTAVYALDAPKGIPGEERLSDDDGDGLIRYQFHYKGATVYAIIVLDPARVFVGTALPEPTEWGGYGLTLDAMAEQYGAVAGINAGGFLDDGGGGNGWPPSGITFSRGISFSTIPYDAIAALDSNHHLWAGYYNYEECVRFGFRDAVCFGPALVQDGIRADSGVFESGIGARTAIGQREDGAIVLVAIDGRQGYSIGVTFDDLADIMAYKFRCINAANMDGGNSTCMYFNGEAVNRSANQAGGTRYLPDAWLVEPLPNNYVKPEGVPDSILLPDNALGEKKEYSAECDEETASRLFEYACKFAEAYYNYFGSRYADYYYPYLLRHTSPGSDLQWRAELALLDRMWVNTWQTTVSNIVLDGAYENGDGTYDVLITSDIFEQAEYWSYQAAGTPLRITLTEAPDAYYGYLVLATY